MVAGPRRGRRLGYRELGLLRNDRDGILKNGLPYADCVFNTLKYGPPEPGEADAAPGLRKDR